MFQDFGRILIILGLIILGVGVLISFYDKVPYIGKLPGDIYIKKEGFSFYAPITSTILISLILSLVLSFIFGLKK